MAEDEDKELFERALQSMSRGDVYRGKFGDEPAEESDEKEEGSDAPSELTVDQAELQRLRDQRMMESAFGGIEKMDQEKYFLRQPETDGDVDLDVTTDDFAAALERGPAPREPEPKPRTEPTLVELAGDDVETINLRGKDPAAGVRELAVFVDLASKDGIPIVQIKVGSNPELREELLGWFREAGAIYALKIEIVDPDADSALYVKLRPA